MAGPARRWRLVLGAVLVAGLVGCAAQGSCGLRECPEEAEIRIEVETLFDRYPDLRPPNIIYVQVRGHVVTLTGEVVNDYGIRLADEIARQAKGVTGVVNLLYVPYASAR
jgi:hypothetical protein